MSVTKHGFLKCWPAGPRSYCCYTSGMVRKFNPVRQWLLAGLSNLVFHQTVTSKCCLVEHFVASIIFVTHTHLIYSLRLIWCYIGSQNGTKSKGTILCNFSFTSTSTKIGYCSHYPTNLELKAFKNITLDHDPRHDRKGPYKDLICTYTNVLSELHSVLQVVWKSL